MAKTTTVVRQQEDETPEHEDMEAITGTEEGDESEEERATREEQERMDLEQQIQLFGSGLQSLFDKQVSLKEELEQRWLDDLRHYNGRYDRETEARMSTPDSTGNQTKQSRVFVNLTRAKSNVAESKWSDLVNPTDDRNWGIKPTPVPSLVKQLNDDSPLTLADGSTAVDPENGDKPYTKADLAKEIMKKANDAANLMQVEIDDQLTECKFNAVGREIIHDAVVMGTGIIKGPMVEKRTSRAWVKDQTSSMWMMSSKSENKPTATRVDPWNYFPDMSAVKHSDCEFAFERHLLTKKQLRKLADQPGFLKEQVKTVLMSAPNARAAKLSYLNELREISGITQIQQDNRYEVLEYHGPIEKENLLACGCEGVDINDPLEEYEGCVWLCAGIVIKVALNHMDSNDLPYNVLNWEADETNVFGFGVPYRMRAPQRVMNASWRMVLDNAGLSTGPQILLNKHFVEPANGKWELSPRKLWFLNSKDSKIRAEDVMQTFSIDSHQTELTNIFEMAHRLADEETSIPQMQMGAQPGDTQQPAMLKTLGGTALWMGSNNIMMRRAVKNWDDNIIVPFIGRVYDWNMQFNEKDEIKGDYSIDARGTSVLLVREMQARNMETFINVAMSIPGGPNELKTRGVLTSMAKGMQVNVDDVMRSDAEFEEEKKRMEEQGPPPDPEMLKLQMQEKIEGMRIASAERMAQMEAQIKMTTLEGERQIALINREVELSKIAANQQVSMQKIQTDAGIKKYAVDWSIKRFFEEVAIKEKSGETANYGLEGE